MDCITKESARLIENFKAYEQQFFNFASLIRNYTNDTFTSEKLDEAFSIKGQFETVTLSFKNFKRAYQNEFDTLMQSYLNKYDEYHDAVMYAIDKRIELQNTLLTKSGTFFENMALARDMQNAKTQCKQSGIEVNRIAIQTQKRNQAKS